MTTQRGRKSAASKLVERQENEKAVSSRLPAPAVLTPKGKRHWQELVDSQLPGYFRATDVSQMVMLCQLLANIEICAEALATYTAKDLKTAAFMRYKQISDLMQRQINSASVLQTRLRLTQHSVTRQKGAGKKQAEPIDSPTRSKKPWE
jgi:hypothetical protein